MEAQPAVCREAHGISRGVDAARLKALGNAVVPQVAEVIGRAILLDMVWGGKRIRRYYYRRAWTEGLET